MLTKSNNKHIIASCHLRTPIKGVADGVVFMEYSATEGALRHVRGQEGNQEIASRERSLPRT